jgi:type I restriction enzyme, S subunit
MQELLTGKKRLPGFQQTPGYKQTEVGEIPEDWEVSTLGSISEVYSGGTPTSSNSSYYGGDIPWITSSDLNKRKIKDVKGRITDEGLKFSSAKKVNKGTLLLALYGATAGVTAITEINATINQAVLAIIKTKIENTYLFELLQLRKNFLIAQYTQGGQPNFSGEIVKSFLIHFPNKLSEQEAIASLLSDMDAEIDALENKLEKARKIKTGMMHNLLTGKIRLV